MTTYRIEMYAPVKLKPVETFTIEAVTYEEASQWAKGYCKANHYRGFTVNTLR